MYILLIAGITAVLLGLALISVGIVQCRRRISSEDGYIPAEAEVIRIDKRTRIRFVQGVPVPVDEFSPVLRYRIDGGADVTSRLPYMLPVGSDYKDCKAAYENCTPLAVRYAPDNPELCIYGDKKPFRIREAVYKFLVGALVAFIGVVLIWAHFKI